MKRSDKIGLLIFFLFFMLNIIRLPTAPGESYISAHYENLYLPNFGLNLEISILPYAFKNLITWYIFDKILLEIASENILVLHQILYVWKPVLIFLAFILFFSSSEKFRQERIFLSSFFTLLPVNKALPYVVGMSTLFLVVFTNTHRKKLIPGTMAWILTFLALALWWHTAHILFTVPIILLLILLLLYRDLGKAKPILSRITTIILVLIPSLAIWVFIRKQFFLLPLNNLLKFRQFFNIFSLFNKRSGNFAPSEFQYPYEFVIPAIVRYLSYLLIFVVIIAYVVKGIARKEFNTERLFAISFVISTPIILFLYYMATESFVVFYAILNFFIIPFLLGYLLTEIKNSPNRKLRKIYFIIFITILSFLILIIIAQYYNTRYCSTEFNTHFDKYKWSSVWIAKNFNNRVILSDANTVGYLAIHYAKDQLYKNSTVVFKSITNSNYYQLINGFYRGNACVVYNLDIYEKKLIFRSLQAWNKYISPSPNIIQENNFNKLYDMGKLWILCES